LERDTPRGSERPLRGAPSPGSAEKGREGAGPRPFRGPELQGDDVGASAGGPTGVADPVQAELARARREAERIREDARREARELRENASRSGLEEGRAEGRRELEAAVDSLVSLAEELAGYKERLFRDAREQVLDLCLALVDRLLGPLVEADEQAVLRVTERALQALSDRETLTIRVHPEDLRRVVDAKPRILATFDGIHRLTVMEDPAVKRGGCLVQTPSAEIDARLETQLAELARGVRGA
jgi:flagellar assembly protein FliH